MFALQGFEPASKTCNAKSQILLTNSVSLIYTFWVGKFGQFFFCWVIILDYKMHPQFGTDLEQTSQFSLKKCCAL